MSDFNTRNAFAAALICILSPLAAFLLAYFISIYVGKIYPAQFGISIAIAFSLPTLMALVAYIGGVIMLPINKGKAYYQILFASCSALIAWIVVFNNHCLHYLPKLPDYSITGLANTIFIFSRIITLILIIISVVSLVYMAIKTPAGKIAVFLIFFLVCALFFMSDESLRSSIHLEKFFGL